VTRLWCGHCQQPYYVEGTVIRGGYVRMVLTTAYIEHVCKPRTPKPGLHKILSNLAPNYRPT
jgi:hypothetical protein